MHSFWLIKINLAAAYYITFKGLIELFHPPLSTTSLPVCLYRPIAIKAKLPRIKEELGLNKHWIGFAEMVPIHYKFSIGHHWR